MAPGCKGDADLGVHRIILPFYNSSRSCLSLEVGSDVHCLLMLVHLSEPLDKVKFRAYGC
jgi:hypothetical protein